jgi:hypothetical protein
VQVREDRGNGADLAGRLGSPGGRVKMLDQNLVHAVIGSEDPGCGSAELNLGLTCGHGFLFPALSYFRASENDRPISRALCGWRISETGIGVKRILGRG